MIEYSNMLIAQYDCASDAIGERTFYSVQLSQRLSPVQVDNFYRERSDDNVAFFRYLMKIMLIGWRDMMGVIHDQEMMESDMIIEQNNSFQQSRANLPVYSNT
jgi:hypothetical protein